MLPVLLACGSMHGVEVALGEGLRLKGGILGPLNFCWGGIGMAVVHVWGPVQASCLKGCVCLPPGRLSFIHRADKQELSNLCPTPIS